MFGYKLSSNRQNVGGPHSRYSSCFVKNYESVHIFFSAEGLWKVPVGEKCTYILYSWGPYRVTDPTFF